MLDVLPPDEPPEEPPEEPEDVPLDDVLLEEPPLSLEDEVLGVDALADEALGVDALPEDDEPPSFLVEP